MEEESKSYVNEMEKMMENLEFRLAVVKETFRDLRIVVNPHNEESTGLLY
jgi:hypothetical protein